MDFSEEGEKAIGMAKVLLNFRPNLESLQKATRHRIGSAAKGEPRCQSAKIERKKRSREKRFKSESEYWETNTNNDNNSEELFQSFNSHQLSSEIYEQHEPPDSTFDSDEEQVDSCKDNSLTSDQRTYRAACSKFQAKPNKLLERNLSECELILKDQGIDHNGTKACAFALTVNRTVRRLDYEGNTAGAAGMAYLSDMLAENIYITDLNLAYNGLRSKGLSCLVEAMELNDTLEKLNISGNGFEENDGALIASLIEGNESIKELNLSHNKFREEGGKQIGQSLGDNTCLEILDLSWNHLRRRGAVAISEGIGQNLGLQKLNLSWNGWYMEGCKALSKAVATNCTLRYLDLTCNRIDKKCLDILLKGLRKNESLITFKIGKNPIGREGTIAIINVLEHIPSLPIKHLDITGQAVNKEFMTSLERVLLIRPLHIKHGVTLYNENKANPEFLHEDPFLVLMEFMRIKNLRLMDLFSSLDLDSSKTVSTKDFGDGLKAANIPLSSAALSKLINKFDKTGDGEVDLGELLTAQQKHKKNILKLAQENGRNIVPFKDTEIGSIHAKIASLAEKDKRLTAGVNAKFHSVRQLQRQHQGSSSASGNYAEETITNVFHGKDTTKTQTKWAFLRTQ